MKTIANVLMGLGFAMFMGYYIIGLRSGADFVHEPFVMLPGSLMLLAAGLVTRFVLPRM